ncbi:hypothetical protein D3C75_1354520 [compost metagenome]
MLGLTLNGDDVEDSGLARDVGVVDCRAYPLEGSLMRMPTRPIHRFNYQDRFSSNSSA